MDTNYTIISRPFNTKDNAEVVRIFQELGFKETAINQDGKVVVTSHDAQWTDGQYVVIEKETKAVVGAYDNNEEYGDMYAYLYEVQNRYFETVEEADEEFEEIELEEYVQSVLLDGEVFVLKETGNEGLRFNSGWAIIIHKANYNKQGYDVKTFDLDLLINDYLEEKGLK